jgi:NADP-dependent 3-hydroxy acid dehydrogenase YdfG
VISTVVTQWGRIDVLVNNASVMVGRASPRPLVPSHFQFTSSR